MEESIARGILERSRLSWALRGERERGRRRGRGKGGKRERERHQKPRGQERARRPRDHIARVAEVV